MVAGSLQSTVAIQLKGSVKAFAGGSSRTKFVFAILLFLLLRGVMAIVLEGSIWKLEATVCFEGDC